MSTIAAKQQVQGDAVLASRGGPAETTPFHIPSLDGIRALAFMLVFLGHAGLRNIVPGGFGVTVFFILSGYLITTLLRKEYAKSGSIDLKAFYLRRIFRILPLFYLVLGVALLLRCVGQLSGDFQLPAILSQVLHVSNYYLIYHGPESVTGGTIVLWSLAVEEHFYLGFPLLYRYIAGRMTRARQGILLGILCSACLIWRLILIIGLHQPLVRTELGSDTRMDSLLLGCLLAIVANPAIDKDSWLSLRRARMLLFPCVAVLLFTFLYRNEAFRYTWRFSLQSIALLPMFVYAVKSQGSPIYKCLNTRLLSTVGVLSYSLYLVHGIFLDWLEVHTHLSKLAMGALALAAALITAKILQIVVERPFLRLRKKYARVPARGYVKEGSSAQWQQV